MLLCFLTLLFVRILFLPGSVEHDVVGEDGAKAKKLGVERGHNGRQHARGEKPREYGVTHQEIEHGREYGRWRNAGRQHSRSPCSDENARHPNHHDAERVGNHGKAEGLGALGREPVLEKMGKHPDAQGDEEIGDKSDKRNAKLALKGRNLSCFWILLLKLDLDGSTGEVGMNVGQFLSRLSIQKTPNGLGRFIPNQFACLLVVTKVLDNFSILGDSGRHVAGVVDAPQGLHYKNKGHHAHNHEDDCLKGVGVCSAT
mgnify:CR=1 FL=1